MEQLIEQCFEGTPSFLRKTDHPFWKDMIIETPEKLIEIYRYFEANSFNLEALFKIRRCLCWMLEPIPVYKLPKPRNVFQLPAGQAAYPNLITHDEIIDYPPNQYSDVDLTGVRLELFPDKFFKLPSMTKAIVDSGLIFDIPSDLNEFLMMMYQQELADVQHRTNDGILLDSDTVNLWPHPKNLPAKSIFITQALKAPQLKAPSVARFERLAELVCRGITELDFANSALCGSIIAATCRSGNLDNFKQFFQEKYGSDLDIAVQTAHPIEDHYEEFDRIAHEHFEVIKKYHPNAVMKRDETANHYRYHITGLRALVEKIEIFHVPNYIESIRRFHLNCVRGFYTGELFYFPSFIFSLFHINTDLRWTSCEVNVKDVVKKYLKRGYITELSPRDKNNLMADLLGEEHGWRRRRYLRRYLDRCFK